MRRGGLGFVALVHLGRRPITPAVKARVLRRLLELRYVSAGLQYSLLGGRLFCNFALDFGLNFARRMILRPALPDSPTDTRQTSSFLPR